MLPDKVSHFSGGEACPGRVTPRPDELVGSRFSLSWQGRLTLGLRTVVKFTIALADIDIVANFLQRIEGAISPLCFSSNVTQ